MTRDTPFIKDWLLFGMVTGMATSLAKTAANYALERAGVPTIPYSTLAGNMLLGRRPRLGGMMPGGPGTRGEHLVGLALDTVVGASFGGTMAYVATKSPAGHEVPKGVLGGLILGAVTFAAGNQMNVSNFRKLRGFKAATLLGTSALWGGLEGWLIGRYAAQVPSQSHPVLVQNTSDQEFEAGRLEAEARRPLGRVAGAHVRRGRSHALEGEHPPLDLGLSPTIF